MNIIEPQNDVPRHRQATRPNGRRLAFLIAALVAAFGALFATATPASASTDYRMNMDTACHYTYGGPQYGAAFYNPASPFSWVCRYVSFNTGSLGIVVVAPTHSSHFFVTLQLEEA
jgi:hypothetical protein